MKLIKSLLVFIFLGCFGILSAQSEDYYAVAMPDAKGSNYLFYKPDSGFASIIKYNQQVLKADIKPVIINYGERVVIYSGDDFTIETDRSNALYFKSPKGEREIFLKTYLSDAPCWGNGAAVYIIPNKDDKNLLDVFVENTIGQPKKGNCKQPIKQIDIETNYADATGTQPASFIEKVAEQVKLVDDKRALLVMLPREHLSKLVSVDFWLYDMRGRQVKEFLNMRAAENVLYINDLRKGKYKYKVAVYDGTLIKEGTVTLSK